MFAAGCVLLVIFHFGWAWQASRAMSRWKEDARKRGEPLSIEEVLVPDANDDRVAYGRHVRALQSLSSTTKSPAADEHDSLLEGSCMLGVSGPILDLACWKIPDRVPFPPKWIVAAEASEQANAVTFRLARQARGLDRSPGRQVPYCDADPHWKYKGLIRYALALRDSADLNHVQGHDLQAVERLSDLMHAAEGLREHPDLWMQISCDKATQFAADSALFMAPGLGLGTGRHDTLRANVRNLIATMLHPHPMNPRTLSTMRAWELMNAESIINDDRAVAQKFRIDLLTYSGSRLFRPALQTMELRMARGYEQSARGLALDTLPALRGLRINEDGARPLIRELGIRLEIMAQRRAAAISLATRLYVADHGRWPGSLEEMVPECLPQVPSNPLMSAGHAMGYIVLKSRGSGGGDRPLVYYGEEPVELDDGIPVDLPAAPGPLLPRNGRSTPGTHTYFDLSRFTGPS